MRRLKLILLVTTIMATLLAMNAGPALAHDGCDWDDCDRDFDELFINDFDDFDDFDDNFGELDDCEFIGFDGDEAIYICEVDF